MGLMQLLSKFRQDSEVDIDKLNLKFIWKGKRCSRVKAISKKNKLGRISLPDIKTYYIPKKTKEYVIG